VPQDRKTALNAPERAPRRGKAARANRREELLTRAAELIARQGFDGTSMRDIAAAVEMLPGSLYYHFASKEDLLLEIHSRVVGDMVARVQTATRDITDPWERLERAAVAHLEGLMEHGHLVNIVSPNFPEERPELNEKLKADRNEYEQRFRALIDALPLREGHDRALMRLQLLGSLNWVPVWFDPARGVPPSQVAESFVRTLRDGAASQTDT